MKNSVRIIMALAALNTILIYANRSSNHKTKRVLSINCQKVSDKQFKSTLERFSVKHLFKPDLNNRTTVRFHFSLEPDHLRNTLFVITSRGARKLGNDSLLYVGPYKKTVETPIDSRLAKGKYYDSVEFKLVLLDEKRVCGWVNSRSYQYWKPNNIISIQFLDIHRVDENELVYMFEVEMR